MPPSWAGGGAIAASGRFGLVRCGQGGGSGRVAGTTQTQLQPETAPATIPAPEPTPLAAANTVASSVSMTAEPGLAARHAFCARCAAPVSARVRDYCLARPKQFAGLVYCYQHQRSL